ncbi:RES domain-containing protein [Burkholderia cenocepacia]|uniref:RES domain-containing protein n=1 Tax=Burkholderia cenocepacia TaxID=95486 RepID=UPI0035BC91BF
MINAPISVPQIEPMPPTNDSAMTENTLNEFKQDSRICGPCLDDIHLDKEIRATGKVDKCDFCRKRRKTWDLLRATTRVHDVLEEYFVKGCYQYDDGETSGDPLSDVVTEILGEDAGERVVPAILEVLIEHFNGDPRDGDEPYWDETENYEIRSGWDIDEYADNAWENFRRRVKSGYRFFNDDAREFLARLFQDVDKLRTWQRHSKGKTSVIYELTDQSIFRGRQVTSPEQLRQFAANPTRELHAPPPSVAKAGRMNPEGVSVFYGSFERPTCVAELRPPLGVQVSSVEFRIVRPLRVLDFTLLDKSHGMALSYFQDDFRNRAMLFRLLRHLHDRIKTPIRPGEEHEYLTTQVLAEYLTAIHQPPLDAVVFGSVQHEEGKNIVIFGRALGAFQADTGWSTDPLRVVPDTVEAVLVKRVDYSTSPIQIPGANSDQVDSDDDQWSPTER